MAAFPTLPDTCTITLDITMTERNGLVNLLLGTKHAYSTEAEYLDEGYMLMLDASEGMIRLRRHYVWDQRNDIAVIPYTYRPSEPIRLVILRTPGIIEISVDNAQTMVSRTLSDTSGGFAISVQDTDATVSGFAVYVPNEGSLNS